jgi:hypothetical protein
MIVVSPTGGPREMQFQAYNESTFDACQDPSCGCRGHADNAAGWGATEEEAIQDWLTCYLERLNLDLSVSEMMSREYCEICGELKYYCSERLGHEDIPTDRGTWHCAVSRMICDDCVEKSERQ